MIETHFSGLKNVFQCNKIFFYQNKLLYIFNLEIHIFWTTFEAHCLNRKDYIQMAKARKDSPEKESKDLTPILDPIDTSSLPDKVEVKLIKYFIGNKMQPGDKIPRELELADTLGVSRTVVREALLRLRMVGLVESKKRRGAILANPDLFSLFQKALYPNLMDSESLKEIFEMRMVLEIGMADLIMERKTEEDIEELEDLVKDDPLESGSYIFEVDYEIAFHGKLYDMTGNNTLKRFQKLLLPVFQYVNESGLLKKQFSTEKFVSHQAIVEAIKSGDAKKLREALRGHFDNHFQRIF